MSNNQQGKANTLRQVNELIGEAEEPLFKTKTIFPFTIFPTEIEINNNMLNLVYRIFFFSKDVYPILVNDIKNIRVATNVFFGSLEIEVEGYEENPPKITFLPKSQALKAKRLIMGLKIINQEGLDSSDITKDVLVKKAVELGKTHGIS